MVVVARRGFFSAPFFFEDVHATTSQLQYGLSFARLVSLKRAHKIDASP